MQQQAGEGREVQPGGRLRRARINFRQPTEAGRPGELEVMQVLATPRLLR